MSQLTKHPQNPSGTGARLLASLPERYRPNAVTIGRLAPKVDQLLAGDWSPGDLVRRLTAGIDSAHSPAGALVRRLEGLALPKGAQAGRPEWCGECDEHTRQREKPDTGLPYRCPDCNPRCVASPPAAS